MFRKFIFAGVLAILVFNMSAQNNASGEKDQVLSKKGKPVLPVSGEFGIGLNALPFIDLFGELVKINSSNRFVNPLSFEAPDGQQLFLKYFKNPGTAYRMKIGMAYHFDTESFPVEDDMSQGLMVADKRSESYTILTASIGLEKRKGLGHIQGIFGAELNLLYQHGDAGSMNYKYSYANDFSSSNTSPSTALFLDGTPRPLFEKTYASFGFGATGFFGLEYFIAPKISVGGEMGLRVMYLNNTALKTRTEEWNPASGTVQEIQTSIDEGGTFDLNVNFNSNGVLFLMFYF
jgi:hypothetical protein